jgi:F-type H+-transporting ATPase subunit b
MIIDWYTVIFQIINFLILVFLLRYFLYGPIIKTMDDREEKIVEREEKAARQRSEAEAAARDYHQHKEKLEQQEEEIMEKARDNADKEKRKLLDKAREEVDETKRRWEEAFEREKDAFITELRKRIGQQSCSVARHCLEDLADARLEDWIWDLFLKKISELPEKERSSLEEALSEENHELNLSTAFEASEEKQEELKSGLHEILPGLDGELNLSVKTEPGLICGLELESGGYRVAWNIDSYLEDVEDKVLKELDQHLPGGQAEEVPDGGEAENQN